MVGIGLLVRRARARTVPSVSRSACSRSPELSALMAAYQDGSPAAFDALYAELAPQLEKYLLVLVRDAARARDLLHETFLQIHRARHTYDRQRRAEPWLFALARHVYLIDRRASKERSRR